LEDQDLFLIHSFLDKMGGPLWTAPEEEYFWTKVVPFSDKRIGHDMKTQKAEVKSWETLANEMLEAMKAERAKIGKEPLREYTALTLGKSDNCFVCWSIQPL
jgi:hypothetical protein